MSGVGGEILSVTVLKTAITVEKLVCKVNLYSGLKRIISTTTTTTTCTVLFSLQTTTNNII